MAIPTVYRSTDPGAPVVQPGVAGTFVAMLKACLVDGYGSKSAAGWTRPYNKTNVEVFQNAVAAGGSGACFRVQDDSTTASAPVAYVGYSSMSDVDTGVNPTLVRYVSRRPGNNATPNLDWIVIADGVTAWFVLWQPGRSGGNSAIGSIGDVNSFVPSDAYRYAVHGAPTNAVPVNNGPTAFSSLGNIGSPMALSLAKDHDGMGGGMWYTQLSAVMPGTTPSGEYGSSPYPDSPWITGLQIGAHPVIFGAGKVLRGTLRGVYAPMQNVTAGEPGDTVSDLIAPGSELVLLRQARGTSSAGGLYVETAKEW